jgi:hypothetical protein
MHERLEGASEARLVASNNLRSGKDAKIHFGRDSNLEVKVPRVAACGGETVLETRVRIGLASGAVDALELLYRDLERRYVRCLETLEAAEVLVEDHDDDNGSSCSEAMKQNMSLSLLSARARS